MGKALKLKELLARVESATGPDRTIDEAVVLAAGGKKKLGDWWIGHAYIGRLPPAYTSSLDVCIALIAKVLPGAKWSLHSDPCAVVSMDGCGLYSHAATPPLALLAATLRALLQIEERKADSTSLALAQKDSQG